MSDNNLDIQTFEVYPDEQPTNNQTPETETNKKGKTKSVKEAKPIFSGGSNNSGFMDKLSNLSTTNAIILGVVLVIAFIIVDILLSF